MRLNFLQDISCWDLQESVAVSSVFFPSPLLLPLTLGLGRIACLAVEISLGRLKGTGLT